MYTHTIAKSSHGCIASAILLVLIIISSVSKSKSKRCLCRSARAPRDSNTCRKKSLNFEGRVSACANWVG